MLLALFAVTGSPERGLLFASMGELGCAGHGLESSKCGAGNGDWSCESLPEPNAPLCHKCTDPYDGHLSYSHCPANWVVTGPPECCKIGHLYMLDELQELVTGFNSSVNGYAYGIKYNTTVDGPFDGQPGCLINREVLNDDTLFPNTPNLPAWMGGMGKLIFHDEMREEDGGKLVWKSWSNANGPFVTCNWEVDREDCLAISPFGFIEPLFGGNYTEWARWAERLDRLAGTSPVSSSVQDCTDDDPLDWGSIIEATYSMARNRDTGCSFGQFTIQDKVGEQPAECEGIDPWAKSADLAIRDAKDLLAKFHADKTVASEFAAKDAVIEALRAQLATKDEQIDALTKQVGKLNVKPGPKIVGQYGNGS